MIKESLLEKYFNQEYFNSADLASELFSLSPENRGVVLLKDLVKPEPREALLEEVLSNRHLFKKAEELYGRVNAEQRFLMYYSLRSGGTSEFEKRFPLTAEFRTAYEELSKDLIDKAGLSQREVSSTGIHIYWPDDNPGLTAHRDSSNIQLVSSFVLRGFSPFIVADDYDLSANREVFEAREGDLLLMRGLRSPNERIAVRKKKGKDYRPIHSVGPAKEERVVILFRHVE